MGGTSLHCTARNTSLACLLFEAIGKDQQITTHWLWACHEARPHTAFGGITPMQKLVFLLSLRVNV